METAKIIGAVLMLQRAAADNSNPKLNREYVGVKLRWEKSAKAIKTNVHSRIQNNFIKKFYLK